MPNSGNTEHGRHVVMRWRMLAERRLNYLIELYETGRWTIYYKEPDFLKVIQEARAALKTWEQLAPAGPARDKPVEAASEQAANSAALAAPLADLASMDLVSADGVEPQEDLRKA